MKFQLSGGRAFLLVTVGGVILIWSLLIFLFKSYLPVAVLLITVLMILVAHILTRDINKAE